MCSLEGYCCPSLCSLYHFSSRDAVKSGVRTQPERRHHCSSISLHSFSSSMLRSALSAARTVITLRLYQFTLLPCDVARSGHDQKGVTTVHQFLFSPQLLSMRCDQACARRGRLLVPVLISPLHHTRGLSRRGPHDVTRKAS